LEASIVSRVCSVVLALALRVRVIVPATAKHDCRFFDFPAGSAANLVFQELAQRYAIDVNGRQVMYGTRLCTHQMVVRLRIGIKYGLARCPFEFTQQTCIT